MPTEEDQPKYLTATQIKKYTLGIDNLRNHCIIRLLINGINMTEIRKIRFKDVKYTTNQIFLKNPRRKVTIDAPTNQILVEYLNKNRSEFNTKNDKIFQMSERQINNIINDYSKGCGFEVTSKILFNSFWFIHFQYFPDWTVLDYNKHLGYNSLDHTKERLEYWQAEYKKVQGKTK